MKALKNRIKSSETKRRQASSIQLLKIVAHGVVRARLNSHQDEDRQFDITEGTKLLEVQSEVNGFDRTLATHWIDYTECQGIAAGEYSIALKDKRELILTIVPTSSDAEDGGARVLIRTRSAPALTAWFRGIADFLEAHQKLLSYAFASFVLVSLGWMAATIRHKTESTRDSVTRGNMVATQQKSAEITRPVPTFFIAAGTPSVRGTDNPNELVVTFAPGDNLIMLDVPVSESTTSSYRVTLNSFADDRELLSQSAIAPKKTDSGWIVEFAIPSSVVKDETHYLVTLATVDGRGKALPVSRFLFKVLK